VQNKTRKSTGADEMTDQDHGKIKIKIADVMKEKQISKTKLSYLAFLQLRQLNNLINEKAARVDFDVLARICHALDCKIEDILEYVPADPEEDSSKSDES
jgi:putative transcriptional regulator